MCVVHQEVNVCPTPTTQRDPCIRPSCLILLHPRLQHYKHYPHICDTPFFQVGACDDGTDTASGAHLSRGCELYRVPGDVPLAPRDRGPRFSSFSSGFMRRGQHPSSAYWCSKLGFQG